MSSGVFLGVFSGVFFETSTFDSGQKVSNPLLFKTSERWMSG